MIHIVTDSTCDGSQALLSHPRVTVVPLYVLFGQEILRDGVEITRDEFWKRLPAAKSLPTTSQVTPIDFEDLFRHLTDAGDELVVLTISSKLSGTFDSAVQAKANLAGRPIDLVDSYSTSIGLGLLVQEAVAMAEAGASRGEIVTRLNVLIPQVRFLFTLDTIEYLARGGRIGRAQAFVGTQLRLKPILGISNGEVVPMARIRSKRKAMDAMVDRLAEEVTARGPDVKLAVTHAAVPQEAAELARVLAERFGNSDILMGDLGPVVGTHVGPGTVGASAFSVSV